MKILKIETGFAVNFSFLLENDFRSVFPGADWNPALEQWEVGMTSENRLKQWVEEVNAAGMDELIDDLEVAEMAQEELERTRNNIAQVKAEIRQPYEVLDDLPRIAAYTKKTVEELEKCKASLLAAEKQIAIEKDAIQADRDRIDSLLAGVIDMADVRRLADIMVGDLPLEDRVSARAAVEKHRDQLAKAGWSCRAINGLCRWNVNRCDRIILSDAEWYIVGRYVKPVGRCRF